MRKLDKDRRLVVDKVISNAQLVEFIVNGSHPFSFVVQNDLIAFCGKPSERYRVFGRTAIHDKIIHKHEKGKLEIKTVLSP